MQEAKVTNPCFYLLHDRTEEPRCLLLCETRDDEGEADTYNGEQDEPE